MLKDIPYAQGSPGSSGRHQRPTSTTSPRWYCLVPSPVGQLMLAGDFQRLTCLFFQDGPHTQPPPPHWTYDRNPFTKVIDQLEEYFAGTRTQFTVPLEQKGTPFQQRVWRTLLNIPYGQTVSYGEIARSIGLPQASRAVGAANGKNPISILVPCHRVIGHSGKLVGYGGGLPIKEKLLAHERQVLSQTSPVSTLFG